MKFVRYFLIVVIFILTGIVYSREVPKLKNWLLGQIQILSISQLGVEIKAKDLGFSLFPPGIELKNVKMQPQGKAATVFSPFTADQVGIYLSATSLIGGRFEIGNINIARPIGNVFIKKLESTSKKKFEIPWEAIMHVPVKGFEVTKSVIRLRADPLGIAMELNNFGFRFDKYFQSTKTEVFAPEILVKRLNSAENPTNLGFAGRFLLEHDAAEIPALKITQGGNFIVARAVARGAVTKFDWSILNGRTVGHVDLGELTKTISVFLPEQKIPPMKGIANFEVSASQRRAQQPMINAEIETQDTQVAQFKIGNISSKLSFFNDVFHSDEIKIQAPAGKFTLQDADVKMNGGIRLSTRVLVENVQIQKLLADLGIGDIPVKMTLNGRIPCEGSVNPEIKVQCGGELAAKDVRVYVAETNKTIVALDNFKITSGFTIDKQKIDFPSGLLEVGESVGDASGQVDYQKGFSFNFHTPGLNFKDVQSLADLKYEGSVEMNGSTSGDSHAGIVDTDLKMKNFWFEDYGVGNASTRAHYEKSVLSFSQIQGQFNSTLYSGQAVVKLAAPTGITARLDVPSLELGDLAKLFSRKFQLPFDVAGGGNAQLDVSGPFVFSELTYNLRSFVKQGTVAGESFSNLTYNVHAIKGHAYADDVRLKKGEGILRLVGDVQNNGNMNVSIKSHGLKAPDVDTVRNFLNGLDGSLDLNMELREHILHPHFSLDGRLTNTALNQEPLEDSTFHFEWDARSIKVAAQLFAQQIQTSLTYPFVKSIPFIFKFDARHWDFSSLFSLIGGNGSRKDYETNLAAKIDLQSEQGDFWSSHGQITINDFFIRHGNSQMQNFRPIYIKFDDGLVTIENWQVTGDNTQLTLTGSRSKKDILAFKINGRIDLSLLAFLTPFLKEMNGQLTLSTQVAGTTEHPEFLGSAFVNRGYFKLAAFPHALEDASGDLLFSQTRVLINKFDGRVAGGELKTTGSISFNGFRNFPADITGDLIGATLTVPEGLQSHGNLHFNITGNWFPYLFKGDYNIDQGLWTKNFEDQNNPNLVKRSHFLPTVILQKDFSALEFDLSAHFPRNLMVKNSMMEAEVRGDLNIKGDPQHPILKGEVNAVPNGKIFFRDTPFLISTAKAKFDSPTENNPTIYTVASARVRDWDISLLFQGTYQKNEIKLTSSPPLSDQNIISLLALGVTDENLDKTTTDPTNLNTAQAGSLIFSQNIQPEIRKKTGINVRLSQNVDDTRNIILPQVIIEKQWTPQVSTSVGRTIGDRIANNANVEYKINRHFSVLGSYEQRDYDSFAASSTASSTNATNTPVTTTNSSGTQTDIFGINLQFQVEFK